MNSQEFCREQYLTLREEIKETKARIFWIAAIALFIAPAGHYVARTMDAQIVDLFLPLLVVSVALLFLSENHALMRCGRFIKHHIEPQFSDQQGWEAWLETPDVTEPRNVDRFAAYAIYLVLGAYYIASTAAAQRYCLATYGAGESHLLLGVYGALGLIVTAFLIRNIRSSTTTTLDFGANRSRG